MQQAYEFSVDDLSLPLQARVRKKCATEGCKTILRAGNVGTGLCSVCQGRTFRKQFAAQQPRRFE